MVKIFEATITVQIKGHTGVARFNQGSINSRRQPKLTHENSHVSLITVISISIFNLRFLNPSNSTKAGVARNQHVLCKH